MSDHLKTRQAGSILTSPLFRRFLVPIVLTMLCFAVGVYFYAVPYLKDLVYSLEEKAVKTDLENIQSLIQANALAIDAYKKSVTSAHKRQLKNITLFTETYLKNKFEQVQNGLITEDEAQWSALEELRKFRYGNNDYVWVADFKGFYLSHPDPKMNMEDFSQVRDVFGNFVLAPLIQQAMEKGEGYNSFWWQRLENDLPAEKLAYARIFPQWEWVIGTGVYLDDLEAEILLRKEKMIEELRQILKPITIAKTGYLYIFDSWDNVIIHPDSQLENSDMASWINPVTKNKLSQDLETASHSSAQKLAYKWNRETDKKNYIYDKIDWVTHVPEFDWYVVASVYTEELNESSLLLRNRILILAGGVVFLSIIIVSILMSRLLNPLRRLSATAKLVEAGDLNAQSSVVGDDEIGILAKSFNSMVLQLKGHIEQLDNKVLERTKELTATVGQLEHHNWEVTQLNCMAENLQACHSVDDIYQVIQDSISNLFKQASGVLYINNDNDGKQEFIKIKSWGEPGSQADSFSSRGCKCLQYGKVQLFDIPDATEDKCHLADEELPYKYLCMPLQGQNKVMAIIRLILSERDSESSENEPDVTYLQNLKRLAITVADHLAMALANMKLQERLKGLSVRDGLTGLFNRRYMEETLEREFDSAERDSHPIGVIMLDVDFFKNFNDTYGHEAGDIVLIELANLLVKSVRKGDVVCRYGGEEFVVILPGPPSERAIERAETIRQKVEDELRIKYHEHTFKLTISLGAAFYPEHGSTPEAVLKAADVALYKAKEGGRNMALQAVSKNGST